MTTTVVYGTDSGTTKAVASRIAKRLNGKILDIAKVTTADLESCDLLILGVPTYGEGDLQSDWEDHLATLRRADLAGKRVALFGLGDQQNYPDSFADAMGILYDEVVFLGAEVIGSTDAGEFTFAKSRAQRNGEFVGLVLDEDNEPEKTGARIASWIAQLA